VDGLNKSPNEQGMFQEAVTWASPFAIAWTIFGTTLPR